MFRKFLKKTKKKSKVISKPKKVEKKAIKKPLKIVKKTKKISALSLVLNDKRLTAEGWLRRQKKTV